jgi:hypothetical protein
MITTRSPVAERFEVAREVARAEVVEDHVDRLGAGGEVLQRQDAVRPMRSTAFCGRIDLAERLLLRQTVNRV